MLIRFHETKAENLEKQINNTILVNNADIFVVDTPKYIVGDDFLHYLLHIN